MKRKIVWVVVSCLMVLSLVMASCAPAAVEEEVVEEEVVEEVVEEEVVEEEVVAPAVEKPKYGGVLRVGFPKERAFYNFQPGGQPSKSQTGIVTNETLVAGDWTKGPAGGYGSNDTTWTVGLSLEALFTGYLAESWELPTKIEGETGTIIYHIRQGVHFALNPQSEASRLVGGRELTTDDVVYTLNWFCHDPSSWYLQGNPVLGNFKITSPAPWVVTVGGPWTDFEQVRVRSGPSSGIHPPEVVEKYGNMLDWKVSVGTGPFMLTDFVTGSTATFVRNPNYWMKDPIGPGKGNQLPYLDGMKFFIIPDRSTMNAALRTAKIDQLSLVELDDARSLKQTAPELMVVTVGGAGASKAAMRQDTAPFNDIRVRRAMMMATDFEAIIRDYFDGEAEISWPSAYLKEYHDAYLHDLDDPEMPESVRELYSYNPEKARELLAEAGYPDGFKTNIICQNTHDIIDYYSVIVDMWSRVGVELELKPTETGALVAITRARNFDGLLTGSTSAMAKNIFLMQEFYGSGLRNPGAIDDPVVTEAFTKIQTTLIIPGPEATAEANRLYKELMKYALDQAWTIPKVNAYTYTIWWPWLKNYSGEKYVGAVQPYFYGWVWIDQELKKSMGY